MVGMVVLHFCRLNSCGHILQVHFSFALRTLLRLLYGDTPPAGEGTVAII